MPEPQSSKAPRFTGDPATLPYFLTRYLELMTAAQITENDALISRVITYVDQETREYWMQLPQFSNATHTWATFRAEVEALYKDMTQPMKYTTYDLQALIDDWSRMEILSVRQLDNFTLKFKMYANSLKSQGLISDYELVEMYMRVLPINFRQVVSLDVRIQHPPPAKPNLGQVQEIVRNAMMNRGSGLSGGFGFDSGQAQMLTPGPVPQRTITYPTPVKTESVDASLAQALIKLTALLEGNGPFMRNQSNDNYRPRNRGPSSQQQVCHFCGSHLHFLNECPVGQQYLQFGKCLKEVNTGQYMYANGMRIQRDGTKCLQQRIDEWLVQNPNFNHGRGKVMLYESHTYEDPFVGVDAQPVMTHDSAPQEMWEVEDSVPVYITTRTGKNADRPAAEAPRRFVPRGPQQVPQAKLPQPVVQTPQPEVPVASRSGPSPPQQRQEQPRQILQRPNGQQPAQRPFVPGPQHQQDNGPAYRNRAPAENDFMVQQVLDGVKKTNVNLTVEQLCAIAPEVRRQVKEFVSVRRLAEANATQPAAQAPQQTHLMQVFHQGPSEDGDDTDATVAAHFLALRTINAKIGGLSTEALLDDGSTVCIISERLWKKFGDEHPMDPNRVMRLETADGRVNTSSGVMENMPVTIGGITYMLQIQVVATAPFDLLLGRPFSDLARTVVQNDGEGNQTLILHDPKDQNRAIRMNTRKRGPKDSQVDFC